jgi:hypothetical protein
MYSYVNAQHPSGEVSKNMCYEDVWYLQIITHLSITNPLSYPLRKQVVNFPSIKMHSTFINTGIAMETL